MVVMGRDTKKGLQVEVTFSGTRVSTTRYNPCSMSDAEVWPGTSVSDIATPPFFTAVSSAFFTVVALAVSAVDSLLLRASLV